MGNQEELVVPDDVDEKANTLLNSMTLQRRDDWLFCLEYIQSVPEGLNVIAEAPRRDISTEEWIREHVQPLDAALTALDEAETAGEVKGVNVVSTVFLALTVWQLLSGGAADTSVTGAMKVHRKAAGGGAKPNANKNQPKTTSSGRKTTTTEKGGGGSRTAKATGGKGGGGARKAPTVGGGGGGGAPGGSTNRTAT